MAKGKPEIKDPRRLGPIARAVHDELQAMNLEAEWTIRKHPLVTVQVGDRQVRLGWALDYERYSQGHYEQHQADAATHGRGLWSGEFTLPWDWRHGA